MTVDDYLDGMEPGEPEFEQDLAERREYIDWARAYPAEARRATIRWERQLRVGKCPFSAWPMYLAASMLPNGILIKGRSDTFKSAFAAALVRQVIALGLAPKVLVVASRPSMPPFADAAITARQCGYRLRYLTPEPGKHSYGTPLLHALRGGASDALEAASGWLRGLRQYHTLYRHGESFATLSKVLALGREVAAGALDAEGWTFANLGRHLADCDPPPGFEDEFKKGRAELVNAALAVGSCDALNCLPSDDRALIDPVKFFLSDRREVLWLQGGGRKPLVGPLLPNLFLSVGAEALLALSNTKEVRLLVVLDEGDECFDHVEGHPARMFQQLRDKGVALVVVSNPLGRAERHAQDFVADFERSAATTIYLSVEDKEQAEYFRYLAGEEDRVTSVSYSVPFDPDVTGADFSPVLYLPDNYYGTKIRDGVEVVDRRAMPLNVTRGPRPRLSVNDVFELFSRPGYGLIRCAADRELWQQSGLMVPFLFRPPVGSREYARREALDWPADPGTLPVTYTDEFARHARESARKAPTLVQGGTWAKIAKNKRHNAP